MKTKFSLCVSFWRKRRCFVGRIRRDVSQPNTLNCWIVADNLRKERHQCSANCRICNSQRFGLKIKCSQNLWAFLLIELILKFFLFGGGFACRNFPKMTDNTLKPEKSRLAFQRNVAIIGVILFIGKLIAWHLTNSDAVFLMQWKAL